MSFQFPKIPSGMQFVPFAKQKECERQLRAEDTVTIGRGIDTRILGWLLPILSEQ